MDEEGTWIRFRLDQLRSGGKTQAWVVETKNNRYPLPLGSIRWYGAWRKYVFFPLASSLYEEDCLREISSFVEKRTAEHRAKKKAGG